MPKKQAGENTKKAAGNAKVHPSFSPFNAISRTKTIHRKQRQPPRNPPSRTRREQQLKTQNGPKAQNQVPRSPPLPCLLQATSDPRRPYREDAEAKKAEAARKKAEKDALLAEEERNAPSKPKNAKTAAKKTRGLDLSQLDEPDPSSKASPALNASGIENALDALGLTADNKSDKVDRHPERRFKAAYAAYEARRLPELEEEHKGLRRNPRVDMIRKEFEKSPENPFNQVNAQFDSTREEIKEMKERERDKTEARLVGK